MNETPRTRAAAAESDTPDSAPFDSKLRQMPPQRDEDDSDTIYTEQPAAGVTDVQGNSLAGDPHGGAMES